MKKFLLLFAISFFSAISVFSQKNAPVHFPSLEPLFVCDSNSGLSGTEIIKIALEFSLCDPKNDEGQKILSQYKNLEDEILSESFVNLDEETRAEKILALIYEKVLKQYSLKQTYISTMFQKGTYNCVSSSILYFALAKSCGLNVRGNETPSHAFCTVYLSDGRKIDVETTNPHGFNPGTKKSESVDSKRYYVVPKKNYSNRKEVTERKFISLIGKNVVAEYDEKKNFAVSVPLSAARLEFVKVEEVPESEKKDVRIDFDTAVSNFAVDLDKSKKSDLALDWLDEAENRWGKAEFSYVQKLYDDVSYNCAVNFIKSNQAEKAKEIFESKKQKITEKKRVEIQNLIFYSIVDEKAKNFPPDEAISLIQEARKSPEASDKNTAKKLETLEEYYWSEKIKPLTKAQQYLEAASILDDGIKSLPQSRNLQTMKNQCLNNYAVGIHNNFVDFYNKKDYENAEKVLREGLEIVPKNATLQRDLRRLDDRR